MKNLATRIEHLPKRLYEKCRFRVARLLTSCKVESYMIKLNVSCVENKSYQLKLNVVFVTVECRRVKLKVV